jgi:hypothetical protein
MVGDEDKYRPCKYQREHNAGSCLLAARHLADLPTGALKKNKSADLFSMMAPGP